MAGYLIDKDKGKCYGCEACVQICPKSALKMEEDDEGFRYPILNKDLCVKCNLCHQNMPVRYGKDKYVFGGYIKDEEVRFESTSGGAFSAIVDTFCDDNYVIFGAESKGLLVWHSYITDKKNLAKFRKSKYSQSKMGKSYQQAKDFLNSGKKVLFSGTPCQISGLKAFLRNTNQDNLLTVEVICEGVPSPLYIRKYEQSLKKKFGALIESIDYRYKGHSFLGHHKWDFEIMRTTVMMNDNKKISDKKIEYKLEKVSESLVMNFLKKESEKDRWFNPFWYIWLKHLMSRPSCYECLFTTTERTADISLGDLWGVHIYCPELYGKDGGSSLAIANTEKGKSVLKKAEGSMYGHELRFEDVLRYQGPMRKHIEMNPKREQFMQDLKSEMDIEDINRKWADKPSIKLLWQKYVWGNRQKVFVWSIWNRK